MPARTYIQIQEEQYSPFSLPKLPTEYILIIYARQSAKDAPIKNKESYDMQTVRLVEYGRELGWTDDDKIIVKIENKRKNGKWRAASGTLRIDQREGLQSGVWLIEADQAKAVMVWAVDRLFRHEDMIEPAVFVRICKEHHTVILTHDDFFDFNNPKRDDRRRFLELAQQAADYVTKHVKGRMIPAKYQVARRGEYDGRTIPIGFILLEGEKRPHEYAQQAVVLRDRIFKRYRELDAQFNLLWREIAPIRDLFPPYPKEAVGVKGYMKEGPFGLSRAGLEEVLTNIAYDGSWYFKEKGKSAIIIPDVYPRIIDHEDFMFAFNNLSKTTLTGEPNEQRKMRHQTRFTRVGTIPAQALLDGIVTSPYPGYHVYVYQRALNTSGAGYVIRGPISSTIDYDIAAINFRVLDKIFEQRLEYRLRMFQATDLVRAKAEPGKSQETIMYEYLKQVQASIDQSNAGVGTQLEEYIKEAASLERTLHYGAEDLDKDTIKNFSQRLVNLKTTIGILSKKDEEAGKTEEALRENAKLLADASIGYSTLPFNRKHSLVILVTGKIELIALTKRWLQLSVEYSPFMGLTVRDIAFIWRSHATIGDWTDEEKELLRSVYSKDRDTILRAFPDRGWLAIRREAVTLGIRRPYQFNNSPLPDDHLSYNDLIFMQENELEFSENEPLQSVWWKKVTLEKNDTRPRT